MAAEITPAGPVPAEARLELSGPAEDRPEEGYRVRTARGVMIVSAFRVGLAGLNLLRNVVLAAFLTASDYGLWALVVTTLITLAFLKQVGITDKYVQQREEDQELAFQRAFSLELTYSALFYVVVSAAIPVYALVIYDRPDVLLPAAALSLSLLASAFQSPIWVFYRRMDYAKQMRLEVIDPVVTTVGAIALLIAGMGIWGLVIGSLAGSLAGSIAAVLASPYRLRLRFHWDTFRDYLSFSWPLFLNGLAALVVVQGALIVGNAALGLAAVGFIGLAGNFARFSNRLELLLRRTLYPAVCSVDPTRTATLQEVFEKSNRIGLMWAVPFGTALALFAPDLVTYVLGERWREAVPLLQVFGFIFALGTVGFAWAAFYQARGNTKPIAVGTALMVVTFFAITVPLILTVGVMGYAYGMAIAAVAQLVLRRHFLRRLFPHFALSRHIVRALIPSIPAVAAVLLLRLASADGDGGQALLELALYVAITIGATMLAERALLGEALGYLRSAVGRRKAGATRPGAAVA